MKHSVPLYEIIRGSTADVMSDILVMPFLRPFNNPPFVFVDEVVDFVRQTLEVRPSLYPFNCIDIIGT